MRSRFALILAALAAVLGALLLLGGDREDAGSAPTGAAGASTAGAGTSEARGAAPSAAPPSAQVRGCADRAQGTIKLEPDPAKDTIIGPLAIPAAPDTYRSYAKRPDRELQPLPGVGMPAMKLLAWLPAGKRVTLVVPRGQRPWMRLVYGDPPARAWHAVTLQACRTAEGRRAQRKECRWRPYGACVWGHTTFAGGIGLDFVNAPRRGLCANLIVWVKGRERPLRKRVFRPDSGKCARDAG